MACFYMLDIRLLHLHGDIDQVADGNVHDNSLRGRSVRGYITMSSLPKTRWHLA